jgi:hypothetical protein
VLFFQIAVVQRNAFDGRNLKRSPRHRLRSSSQQPSVIRLGAQASRQSDDRAHDMLLKKDSQQPITSVSPTAAQKKKARAQPAPFLTINDGYFLAANC